MKIIVKGVTIADITPEETQFFIDWTKKAFERTSFDLFIFSYPRIAMFIAEKDGEPLAFLPVQTAIMAECFIPKPDATNKEKAAALGRFDEALMDAGRAMGIGDVYCWVPLQEEDYAEKIQRHGWMEVPGVRLFKKRTGVSIKPISEPSIGDQD
jgi:hypothetical protein